jgi:hypothetical protein
MCKQYNNLNKLSSIINKYFEFSKNIDINKRYIFLKLINELIELYKTINEKTTKEKTTNEDEVAFLLNNILNVLQPQLLQYKNVNPVQNYQFVKSYFENIVNAIIDLKLGDTSDSAMGIRTPNKNYYPDNTSEVQPLSPPKSSTRDPPPFRSINRSKIGTSIGGYHKTMKLRK